MSRFFKLIAFVCISVFFSNVAQSKENFFNEALKMFENKKYDDAKFMFERNIVFNPKDAKSYLYLAKIYNYEKDQRKEERERERRGAQAQHQH